MTMKMTPESRVSPEPRPGTPEFGEGFETYIAHEQPYGRFLDALWAGEYL